MRNPIRTVLILGYFVFFSAGSAQILVNLDFEEGIVGRQPEIADATFSPGSNNSTNGAVIIDQSSAPVNPLSGKSLYVYDLDGDFPGSGGSPTHLRFPFNGETNRTEVRLSFDFQRAYATDASDAETRVHVALGRVGDSLNNSDFRPFELRILNNGDLVLNSLAGSETVASYLTDSANHIDLLANSHDLNTVNYDLNGLGTGAVLPNTLHLFLNEEKIGEYDFHSTPDPTNAPQIIFNQQDDDLGQLAIYQDTRRQGGVVFDNILLSPITEIFGPPTSPESLLLVTANPFSVKIEWTDASTDETGFIIERRTEGEANFESIATVTTDVSDFTDDRVLPETNYSYRVIADNGFKSDPSNELAVTTPEQVEPLILNTEGQTFALVGTTASFSVDAVGRDPLTYQWYAGETGDLSQPVEGAVFKTFESEELSADSEFWVRVSNNEGQADSLTFSVTVRAGITYEVDGGSAIEDALALALPGDCLVLANGTYDDLVIHFEGNGQEGAPITLKAESPGSVILTEASRLEIGGQWLVVDGFTFSGSYSGNDDDVIQFRSGGEIAVDCRLTNSSIIDYVPVDGQKTSYVAMYGQRNRVDHCYFSGHDVIGVTLVVWLDGQPNNHLIDHNHFANRMDGGGENGWETIRIGTSDTSLSDSQTIVEHNLFSHVDGEIEIISNKSGENIYRYNTFFQCRGTLTLRHGNRCRVEGNYFIGGFRLETGGVRVIGEDHVVVNNYFESTTARDGAAITLYAGVSGGALNEYVAAHNAVIAFNTLVNNTGPFINVGTGFGSRDRTILPTGILIANNILDAGDQTQGDFVTGENPHAQTWAGNIAFGRTTGGGVAEGFRIIDPLLLPDSSAGIQRISAFSPAVDSASNAYDSVDLDIDGQPRVGKPDVGADELPNSPGESRGPLTQFDVGPSHSPFAHPPNTTLNIPFAEEGWPELLSETGAFKNLGTLEPERGILPYEPNVPFWSDHARKTRWFYIPVGTTIGYSENGNWQFPTGSVWIKHFDLDRERGNPARATRVETRFLVKTEFGTYGVSYRWNEAQTEATLVGKGGEDFDFTIRDGTDLLTQTWTIPSRSDCLACHTSTSGFTLSFNTRQLNRDYTIGGMNQNLLGFLSKGGFLDVELDNPYSLPYYAHLDDPDASLDLKARSYLAVNCVSCHLPGGTESDSFDVRPHRTLDRTRLINGVPSANSGNEELRLIKRGSPEESVIYLRMLASQGFMRMPPLGSNELDLAGADLIRRWIGGDLARYQSFEEWQTAQFGENKDTLGGEDEDPDKDGDSNGMEYLNLTDPLSGSEQSRVVFDHSGGHLGVGINAGPFSQYYLECSQDLENWRRLDGPNGGTLTTPEGELFLQVPLESNGSPTQPEFYRFVGEAR